ncbi:MAG: ABC transporter substrate-binding protein [Hoeflea sp.]|uniref:ABC transporter substrate-binding protein n=1 Tax=Hoeflea sp. TaxID=1940281 RepID=UPI001D725FE4|nr:ABC transporter substrate-binding protein [Hoeflea sp.]MBU4529201.1 ABC transporter substrate-binding protein [Alphaproteobacteria bacterium]MBU4543605.1 ABC transporter substrate-binding protein [Alphaproteobacteria bacterium]MBU4549231.1 ABC transporter substrate-binding protein [Alphaproteobacteria bacterium]MBV1725364.1 ABC transporter substrate-binding protein [Hoeflea sp.]MBV1785327.1 ABC transporter substrate-binding protein [Hoeflea sp.]
MISRRRIIKTAAAGGLIIAAGGLAMPAIAQNRKIRIGYVSPQTGPLAGFAEADAFTIDMFNRYVAEQGMDVEVIVKDSQSNPNRAADVAQELIIDSEINLMLVASTPETTNPVSTVCESEGVPTISTKAPWQPWFIGQQGNPGNPESWRPFDFTYHYFWGLEDVIAVFTNMWNQLETNKKVGGLFPNDADGNAWGDPNVGVAPGFAAAGYETVDPGRFQNLTDDFTAQINAFKQANTDIITGVVIPPDFTTFRNQAIQQGLSPKAITVAKAILFPQSVETLGQSGHNLSSEVWWSANHPFSSSLTGQSCAELAAAFTEATGRPWTQPIGFVHSLFEMAADVIKRADDPTDAEDMAETIAKSDLNTIVGRVAWNGEGVPPFAAKNVCKTPLVGGQWRRKDDGTFDLVVVDNQTAPNIPTQGVMEALS